jgi:glycosyltransferase involved in cell wall biosynthesis
MRISVVIPAFNEAATLPRLRARLTAVAEKLSEHEFEFVLVDDHSADATPVLIEEWTRADPRVRGLRLARNSGSHAAVAAGLARCTGDCAAVLAADLQDPPELLERLLAKRRAGFDIVWAVRVGRRGGTWLDRACSRLYWSTMRRIVLPDTPEQGADVVLLDRRVVDALTAIGEKNTSLLSLVVWLGFRQTSIAYVKCERTAGRSGWTWAKRCQLAIDSIVSFSTLPLRLTWLCGLLFLAATVAWVAVVALGGLAVGPADAAIIGLLLLGFGVLLTFLGALGEYVWRVHDQVRGRPAYVVERLIGSVASRFVPTAAVREVTLDAIHPTGGLEGPVPATCGGDHPRASAGVRKLHVHAGAGG